MKRLLGWSLLAPLIVPVLLLLLNLAGASEGGILKVLYWVVLALSVPLLVAGIAAMFYGLIWVVRNLQGSRRFWWIVALVLGGLIGVIAWWFVVARHLPESDGDGAVATA